MTDDLRRKFAEAEMRSYRRSWIDRLLRVWLPLAVLWLVATAISIWAIRFF